MKLLLALLLLGVAPVHSQVVFSECLAGWYKFSEQCYKFIGYPRLKQAAASGYCQTNGATLISVNDLQEQAFVIDWLEKYDGARDTWLTSGYVTTLPEGVQWLGDGTSSTSFGWHSTVDKTKLEDGDIVIFSYSGTQYSWSVGDGGKNSSFICEIPLQDTYKIVEEKRDFDYGLAIDNPELAPRGPKFMKEPVETTILSKTTAAYLDCLADGIPKPEYSWWNGEGDTWVQLQTGPGTRFTMTGGRLTIDNPKDSDAGNYQCRATNQFGTILSTPVALSFGSLGNFSNVATAEVNGQVSDGAVIECPTITFKPAVSYQWHKQKSPHSSMTFIRPEVQTHTFVSNSGKLYFSELAPSDDDIYFCSVTLTSRGVTGTYIGSSQGEVRTSLGFRLNVGSGVSSEYMPVIQDDFVKVYPGNPKRGQIIELECFAYGTGSLDYRWFREGGKEMPRTATFSETRRVMTIEDVQIEDSGQYRCRVDSRSTSLSDEKNFTLNVQSEPYFSYPLADQHIDLGSRLTWHCEARGIPPPTYRWYKDGQPLQNSTGVKIIGNTMVIDRVEKERDNGMYQCSAKNLYGTTYSSAQIRVLEFKPTFTKQPVDSSLSAAVGGNITIVCNPEAAPAPTYQWLQNDRDLGLVQGGAESNGFQMLLNGNLFITNVNNNHRGKYTCKVTNTQGEASSSGVLRIFARIVISQKPGNVEGNSNETATMICTASAPANVDVVYVWTFNNHIIDFNRQVEYRMGSGSTSGNLIIQGLQYEHEGRYTCEVTTGMDSETASAYLTVKGPPGEPSGVLQGDNVGQDKQEIVPGERFVRLYWSDGLDHGSTILAYTVEFRTNFDRSWRVHPDADQIQTRFVQSNEYPDKRTILLTKLKPWAGHEFRVKALNRYGIGAPSLPTIVIQIPGTAPIVAPSGVSGGGGKVGDLTITWRPLPMEDYNGPDLKYVVHWRTKPNSQADDSRWQDSEVTPEEACQDIPDIEKGLISVCKHTVLVGDEYFYLPYEARVRANNVYGAGVLSNIATVMSAEEMPTGTPRNVYSVSFNATALDVYWTPVKNTREEMKGRLTGYRINYWDREEEEEEQARFNIIAIPPGKDNIEHGLIIGLVPGHWYVCNVQSISSAGYGPKGEDYPQETANYAPALYPTEVHVYSIDGIGVQVNFRGISTNVAEEPLMGYMIQY
ncbi:contactin-like isoform X2 [Littorina saxatilis]